MPDPPALFAVGHPWLLAFAWGLVGWGLGLGLNHVIHQLPRDQALAARPRCEQCGATIRLFGLPRWGPCAGCGERLPYDRVEWLLAGLFIALAVRFGFGPFLLVHSFYTAVLVIIALIDWRHRYVYTVVVYPAILASVVLTPLVGIAGLIEMLAGLLVGVVLFGAIYLVGRKLHPDKEALGKGDIEIAAMTGAMVGVHLVLSALVLGVFISGLVALALLLTRRRGRQDFFSYGPGLCLGTFLAFFMQS